MTLKMSESQSAIVPCKDKSPAASPYTPTITRVLSDEDLLVNPCLPSLNQITQKQTPKIQKNTMARFPTQSGQLWEVK